MEEFIIPVKDSHGQTIQMEVKQKFRILKCRKVKSWSTEEDRQLIHLYNQFPRKWACISNQMTNRNQNQCLHRFRRLTQIGGHKKIWSQQQDQTILELVSKIGKNWKALAEALGTKTGKQIRERFINKLDPKINQCDWSEEEDKRLLQLYFTIGSRWSQISKKLEGRPENKIKNRFYSYIVKNYDIKKRQDKDILKVSTPTNNIEKGPKKHQSLFLIDQTKENEDGVVDKENYQLNQIFGSLLRVQDNWIQIKLSQEKINSQDAQIQEDIFDLPE